jgi:nucleoside-diphosphate-sugar epimerase
MSHISTCYAVCNKVGVIEERLIESPINWNIAYDQILSMDKRDLEHYEKNLLGSFPNTYTFTKRMAEHLLVENNKQKRIPLVILRPSIIGASLEEPVPGWTDSITLAGGIYLIAGLGILKELPGEENYIGDQVPVDIVVN